MPRVRSLTQLREDLRWQADQLGAALRHDNTALTRIINQSIQRWREWVSEQGSPLYLTPHSGTLTVGATSPYAFGTLDSIGWSPTPVHIYQFEITVNGEVLDVPQIPFEHRNQHQAPLGNGTHRGVPVGWFRYGSVLGLVPPPQSAYAYTAWFMGQGTDLSADGDTFDGIAGWEEWLIWDGLIKILVRDHDNGAYAVATTERDRIQVDFLQRLRQDRPSVAKRYNLRDMRSRRVDR